MVGTAPRRAFGEEDWDERGAIRLPGMRLPYRVVRSARRRKTIEMSVDARGVRISAPLRTPWVEIDEFVRSRRAWLIKHVVDTPRRGWRPLIFQTGELLPFLGRRIPLVMRDLPIKHVRVTLGLTRAYVEVPIGLSGAARQIALQDAMRAWYRARATEEIDRRVRRWSRVTGLHPNRVLVRDQRRRWGSCSPDGTLRFNWRLVMAAPALIDYIVVHELVHLRVPHHGPRFWARVKDVLPDYEERKQTLRDFGLGVSV